jgi:hypothetical protein
MLARLGGTMNRAVLRWGGLVIIILVAAGLFAVFRDRLPASSQDLKVGDCFDLSDPTASSVDQVPHHPCTESHMFEVFFNATNSSPADATYPPLSVFGADVAAQCKPAFEAYVGISFDASALDINYLYPQSIGWGKGDRTITCYLARSDNAPMTSSMKGAKQ